MLNVQIVPARFEVAYPFSLAEAYPAILSIVPSGSYSAIPYANENFDIYATGFRAYFSGSGFWMGSGFCQNKANYLYDSFENYPTGSFSGLFLTGNLTISGWYSLSGLTTGTAISYP